MADGNWRSAEARARDIRPTDLIVGADPDVASLADAIRVDTLAELIQTIFDGAPDGLLVPEHLQEETSALLSRAGILFWRVLNLVPDTPGEESALEHVLTVIGTDDRSYAWRPNRAGAPLPSIRSITADTQLVDGDRGKTVRLTGADPRTVRLPSASGESEVADGWDVTLSAAEAELTVRPHGTDAIVAGPSIVIPPGEAIRIQKVHTAVWTRIADTERATPGGGGHDQDARNAAAAAAATALANRRTLDRLAVFGQYELNPAGIPGNDPPDFIALTLSSKKIDKVITHLRVNLAGIPVADLRQNLNPMPPATDLLAPFNLASNIYNLSGGIVNLAFPSAAQKGNFRDVVRNPNVQFVEGSIDYTFADGTTPLVRFRTPVGASPAVLPAGTEDLVGYASVAGRTDVYPIFIPIEALPAVPADVGLDMKNLSSVANSGDNLSMRATYVPGTRTLTYAISPAAAAITGGSAVTITRLIARGFR